MPLVLPTPPRATPRLAQIVTQSMPVSVQ